ncbi:MAG: KamA family radical SAM protein [Desulfosoma sp.]|uniref:KamA family radical SAM protein n=1 Tax=Desulfosoma sp. TaxID=2603217 RepID=UPI0040493729
MISLEEFAAHWKMPVTPWMAVHRVYPFVLSRHFADLIRAPEDPLWRQVVPDSRELDESDPAGLKDPLGEESRSPVPNLVHRYPDRVLWIVTDACAVHCRFCTRKRRWTHPLPLSDELIGEALRYIRKNPAIHDVILSGGDPLMLPWERLEELAAKVREIPHVRLLRLGTRVPFADPGRVTPAVARRLAAYGPLYMNIHVNHPWEITQESREACRLLADAGIPLGSQTVLLKDINDSAEVLGTLFTELLSLRVRPYYLLHMDLMQGTAHFRTPLAAGAELMAALRNRISGLAIPHFVVDLPNGLGKVPITASAVVRVDPDHVVLRNFAGHAAAYPLKPEEGSRLRRVLGLD